MSKRRRIVNYPTSACPTCGRVLRNNLMPRHARTHADAPSRLFVPPDEQAEIVRLYRRGGTLKSVAADTFWSKTEVRRVLLANGVQLRPRGTYGPKISSDEALRRTQLYGRGLSIDEVAAACGVSRVAITQTLKREGVRIRPVGVNRRWERQAASAARESA